MRNTIQSLVFAVLTVFALTSCSPDDFNSGWDQQIVATTVTLDHNDDNDIVLGTLNIEDEVLDYINENESNAESYTILSVESSSGSVASKDLFNMSFVEELEVIAVQDANELLIARLNGSVSNSASGGLQVIDSDLYVFGSTDDIEIVLRPTYHDTAPDLTEVDIDIRLAANFTISGTK